VTSQVTPPRRKNIRLPRYDYSSEGCYFVTIVTHMREPLFGEVVQCEMVLNEFGRMVEEEWVRSATIREEVELDEFVVMPNHFHAVVHIIPADPLNERIIDDPCRGDRPVAPTTSSGSEPKSKGTPTTPSGSKLKSEDTPTKPIGPRPKSLGALMAGFKSAVTTRINTLRHAPGTAVWQRNYFEHIIGSDREYECIVEYIVNNPMNWLIDEEYK